MSTSSQGQQSPGRTALSNLHVPLLGVRSCAITMEVFLRRGMGSRYMDFQAALAVPLIIVFANLWPQHDVRPMYWFLFAYLYACACHRAKHLTRMWRRQPETGHSYYTGTPILARNFPRQSEMTIKRVIEPGFLFIVGAVICQINVPLGAYLMLGATSLLIINGLSDTLEKVRAQDLNDSLIEQQGVAERFRDMRGER